MPAISSAVLPVSGGGFSRSDRDGNHLFDGVFFGVVTAQNGAFVIDGGPAGALFTFIRNVVWHNRILAREEMSSDV